MATHDKDISSSADRVLTIRDGSIEEQIGNHWVIYVICHNRRKRQQNPVSSLVKWSVKMEVRNPIETVGRVTPALVAILLSYALLSGQDFQLQDSRLHHH